MRRLLRGTGGPRVGRAADLRLEAATGARTERPRPLCGSADAARAHRTAGAALTRADPLREHRTRTTRPSSRARDRS